MTPCYYCEADDDACKTCIHSDTYIDPQEEITKLRETVAAQAAVIEALWQIIDDIDTYGDMAKSDDVLFRSLVERRQKDRWKTGITTDGYTLAILTDSTQILDEVRQAERDALKSKIDRLKYIMASNAYKDGATLSVEICVLDDEAVGDFSERICWFVDRAME